MKTYFEQAFDDEKGATCEYCMLSFSKGETQHCAALGSRPRCPKEGCRKDCPLKTYGQPKQVELTWSDIFADFRLNYKELADQVLDYRPYKNYVIQIWLKSFEHITYDYNTKELNKI